MQEVWDKKDAEAAAKAEAKAEEERAKQLQAALMRAAEAGAAPTRSTSTEDDDDQPEDTPPPSYDATDDDEDDEPMEVAGSGTHEYECTKCGYVLFPAAGREHKFFGAGFTCPQCNAPKSDFVDNGPVD
jgi:rubredoxin